MNKQRWYCYFFILIMIFSIVSSIFVHHPSVRADANPPTVTINFAGNLSDTGGPYWRPPGESTQLTGIFSDGYYTNDSRQSEGWIYINLTVSDVDGIGNVWLNWLNETTWTNWTYPLVYTGSAGAGSEYWEINTSGNISTRSGYNYSFDIVANDTVPNSITVPWNKTGDPLGGATPFGIETRRYVQLNCTPVNISYTPYYFYNLTDKSWEYKHDRLRYDQGQGAVYDVGYLFDDIPTATVQYTMCSTWVAHWFAESVCIDTTTIENIYYHVWYSTKDGTASIGWNHTREDPPGYPADPYSETSGNCKANITAMSKEFNLSVRMSDITDYTFTDNSIYEFLFLLRNDGEAPGVTSNRSFTSFILFNVPDNATLNASYPDSDSDSLSDWTELYVTYTNPFVADTDNDDSTDYWENSLGTDPNNYTDFIESQLPAVTTNVTTGKGQQNITLHGYLSEDGNETCRVGFEWGETDSYGKTDFNLTVYKDGNPDDSEGFKFPKDIWLYNSSVNASSHTPDFFTAGEIYSNLDIVFRWPDLANWWGPGPGEGGTLQHIDNKTDEPTYSYQFDLDANDNLSFTYDNLTTTEGNEFGYEIGIEGGYPVYGLLPGQRYHYRAFATNSNGTAYGSDMSFLMNPGEPRGFSGNASGGNIDLTWAKGYGAEKTVIRKKGDSYPTSPTDGSLVYNDTGTSHTDALNYSNFYSAWSYTDNGTLFAFSTLQANLSYGNLIINCFDEETNLPLNFNVFISDQNKSQTYTSKNNTNPLTINAQNTPHGDKTNIRIEAAEYLNNMSEEFSYPIKANRTVTYVILTKNPDDKAHTNVTCSNTTGSTHYYPTFTLSDDIITIFPDASPEFDRVIVNYTHTEYNDRFYIQTISLIENQTINAYLPQADNTQLYVIEVIDEYEQYIEDVYVQVRKYINGSYKTISKLYTGANGRVELFLIPGDTYTFNLTKSGYISQDPDHTPDPIYYGRHYPITFKLRYVEEEIEPLTPGEVLVFTGSLYSNNTINICYYDKNNETLNTHFLIYEIYNATRTFVTNHTNTTDNDFCFWKSVSNASRMHIVVLYLNHTTLGYVSNYTIHVNPIHIDRIPGNWIERRWAATFGNGWEYGYVNVVLLYFPFIIILLGLGAVGHPSIGAMSASLYIGGVTWYVFLTNEEKILTLAAIGLVLGFIAYVVKKGRGLIK